VRYSFLDLEMNSLLISIPQKLKETCQSYLKIPESSNTNEDSISKRLEPETRTTSMVTLANTKPIPGPLIALNPAPNSTNTDTTTTPVTPISTTTPALVEFRRTRARILLDTLTSMKP